MDTIKQRTLYLLYFISFIVIMLVIFFTTDLMILHYLDDIHSDIVLGPDKERQIDNLLSFVYIGQGICIFYATGMFITMYKRLRKHLGDKNFIVGADLDIVGEE